MKEIRIPIALKSIFEHFTDLAQSNNRFMAAIQYLLDACENVTVNGVLLGLLKPISDELGLDSAMVTTMALHKFARDVKSGAIAFSYE